MCNKIQLAVEIICYLKKKQNGFCHRFKLNHFVKFFFFGLANI